VFNAYAIETSNIKLLGGVIAAAAVAVVIYKIFGGTVMAYLRQSSRPSVRMQSSAITPVG
jgi:hypothetical protein